MKTIKQIISEYESRGGLVKFRVDKDGHVRVYQIDGQTFNSRQGATVLRRMVGEPLTASEYETRRAGSETISRLASSGLSVQSQETLNKWKKIRASKPGKKAKKAKATQALPRLTKKEELERSRINRRLKKAGKTERLKARTMRKRKLEERHKRQRGEKSERVSTIAKRVERYRLGYAYIANVKAFVEYIGGVFSTAGRGYRLLGADDIYNDVGIPFNFYQIARDIWTFRDDVMDIQIREAYALVYSFMNGSSTGQETQDKLYKHFNFSM